jgi:lipoprotein NlpI
MKFAIGGVAALVFALCCRCVSLGDEDLSAGYGHVKPALVKVWAFNAHGTPIESGTGFVIASDAHRSWIVTALHVVARSSKVKIDISREVHDLPATIVAKTTEQRDIVLLRIARGNLHPVQFAPRGRSLLEGNYVAAAGYFKNDEQIGVSGQLPQLIGPGTIGSLPDDGKFIAVNLDLEPGLSGAPLFDPDSGDVVGVLDTKSTIGHSGYAVAATPIVLDFLAAHHMSVAMADGPPAAPPAVAQATPHPAPVATPKPEMVFVAATLPPPPPPPPPVTTPVPVSVAVDPPPTAPADGDLKQLYLNRSHTENGQGRYDLAIFDLTQALHIDPNDPVIYNNRGFAYYGKGDNGHAIADLTQALRLDPNYLIAYYNRGCAYNGTGQYELAVADLTSALRINPSYAIAYDRRGYVYESMGKYDLAIADFNHAILLNPRYALAYVGRGEAYEKQGRSGLALADYDQALRIDPNARSQILRVSQLYAH